MPKNEDDMIGFQDFLEGQDDKRSKGTRRLDNSGHELMSFLEKENKRLELLTRLYSDKTEMMRNHPQETAIMLDLESSMLKNKNQLIDSFQNLDSHLRRNLREIYRNHFSS